MAVRLIPCRNTETGAEAEIPETGLQHLPAYEPVNEDDRKRLGYEEPAETPAGGDQPPSDPPARKSKPATGSGKKNEGVNDGH